MAKKGSDPHQPAWIVSNNDPKGDEEATPLLGSGPPLTAENLETDTASGGAGVPLASADDDKTSKGKNDAKSKEVVQSKSFQDFLRRPPKPWCLHVFHFIEAIATIGCLCLLATQLLPLFILPISQIGYLQLALRTYIALFCLTFVLVEWDVPLPFLRQSHILHNFFSRGFLYTFMGLIGMEEAFSVMVEDKLAHSKSEFTVSWASLFMNLSSYLIVAVGFLYMLMGIFCMQPVLKKLTETYRERIEAYRNLD